MGYRVAEPLRFEAYSKANFVLQWRASALGVRG